MLFRNSAVSPQKSRFLPDNSAPHFALLFVQLCFGSFAVSGKIALKFFPSPVIVMFRVGLAFLAFAFLSGSWSKLKLNDKRDYGYFALYSLVGVTLNQLLSITGLAYTNATNASLLATTIPVFALLVGAFLGLDKLNFRKFFGILTAAFGVVLLVNPFKASFSGDTLFGDLLILLNSLSYAVYISLTKTLVSKHGALKSLFWLFFFGSLICVPLGMWSISSVDLEIVPPNAWIALGFLVVFSTILAYYWNAWALMRVSPGTVAVYIYLQPLIGFVLAVIFLGETLTFNFLLSTMLVFLGVYLVTKKSRMS